jgi:ATP-dependent exoDNAse (exonuclease V) alpha subunit
MMNEIIEATILNVKFKGKDELLPRIPMILTDMSLELQRLQYSVRLAFAMTINKGQGHRYKCVWTKFGKSMLLT